MEEREEQFYVKADPEMIKRQEMMESLLDDLALAVLQSDGVVTV